MQCNLKHWTFSTWNCVSIVIFHDINFLKKLYIFRLSTTKIYVKNILFCYKMCWNTLNTWRLNFHPWNWKQTFLAITAAAAVAATPSAVKKYLDIVKTLAKVCVFIIYLFRRSTRFLHSVSVVWVLSSSSFFIYLFKG